jgi:hypothetical protein
MYGYSGCSCVKGYLCEGSTVSCGSNPVCAAGYVPSACSPGFEYRALGGEGTGNMRMAQYNCYPPH